MLNLIFSSVNWNPLILLEITLILLDISYHKAFWQIIKFGNRQNVSVKVRFVNFERERIVLLR